MFCRPIPYGVARTSKPTPVVRHGEREVPVLATQPDDDVRCLRVLRHVLQRLEHREVDGRLDRPAGTGRCRRCRPSRGAATCEPAPRAPRPDPGRPGAAGRSRGRGRGGSPARPARRRGCRGAPRVAVARPDRPSLRPAEPSPPARRAVAAPRRGCCVPAAGAPRPAPRPAVGATSGGPRSTGSSPGSDPACAARSASSLSSSGTIGSFGGFVTVSAPSSSLPWRTATAASASGNVGSAVPVRRDRRMRLRGLRPRRGRAHLVADAQPDGGVGRAGPLRQQPRHARKEMLARERLARRARRTPTGPRTAWRACRRSRGSRRASRCSRAGWNAIATNGGGDERQELRRADERADHDDDRDVHDRDERRRAVRRRPPC